jgi:hypothetical protein
MVAAPAKGNSPSRGLGEPLPINDQARLHAAACTTAIERGAAIW